MAPPTRAKGLGTRTHAHVAPQDIRAQPPGPLRARVRSSTRCSRRPDGRGRTTACSPRGSSALSVEEFEARRHAVDASFLNQGIGFTVYGEEEGLERIFPFDLIPRVIPRAEWDHIERGLIQRVNALNLFLADVYHGQRILRDGKVPAELVFGARHFRREMIGVDAARRRLRARRGRRHRARRARRVPRARGQPALALGHELHAREPLGDEARVRAAVRALRRARHRPVPAGAARARCATSRRPAAATPTVVLLTPGVHNSAYFEHSFLARHMGIELVEGGDLLCHDDVVYMRTTQGLQRVDVIYRRVDDEFLDPLIFRQDSMLGAPGILNAYRAGNVTLANALGTGVADDKAVYTLRAGDDPLLPRRGADPRQRADLPRRPRRRSPLHARAPRRARRQDGGRQRRLRHADRPASRAPRSASASAARSRRTRASSSRSRRSG